MKERWKIKEDIILEDIQMLSPNLLVLFATVLNFAASRNLPVVVTSLVNDRDGVVSQSSTHSGGRALDLSTRGWRTKDIEDIVKILELKHEDIAAISASTLKPRPAVYHDVGHGAHLHIQVRR
jgi:hypothetical protein